MLLDDTDQIPFHVWLKDSLRERGWSQTELVRRSKGYIRSRATVSSWLTGHKTPSPGGFVGLHVAFSLPIHEVLYQAGLAPPLPDAVKQEEDLLTVFSNMNEMQRETYLAMGKGLVETQPFVNGNGNGHGNHSEKKNGVGFLTSTQIL